jgi:hypothetical protein
MYAVFFERRLDMSHASGLWRKGGPRVIIFLSEKRL